MNSIRAILEQANKPVKAVLGSPVTYTQIQNAIKSDVSVILNLNVKTFDDFGVVVGVQKQAKFFKAEIEPVTGDTFELEGVEYTVGNAVGETSTTITVGVHEYG